MKLHLTATSERGKPVTKSGNEYIELELKDESRKVLATISIKPDKMEIWHGNSYDINSFKDCAMDKPKTAREEIREHNLTLNKETMSYYDESGNEYRREDGTAIFYNEVN